MKYTQIPFFLLGIAIFCFTGLSSTSTEATTLGSATHAPVSSVWVPGGVPGSLSGPAVVFAGDGARLLAQAGSGFGYDTGGDHGGGGISRTMQWVIIIGVVLFVFFVQVLLGVFVALDGRKKQISGWWAWGLFTAFPLLGIMGLFIYLFVSMSGGSRIKEEQQELIQRSLREAHTKGIESAKAAASRQLEELQAELERVKASVPDMPTLDEEEVTMIMEKTTGNSGIMLIHMGGDRDGHPEELDIRNHVTGQPKKVTLGKNADKADIAVPWDETVSRRHCELSFEINGEKDTYYVFDLNSSNGTFISRDGQPFSRVDGKAYLSDGDILRVGKSQFRVVIFKPVKGDAMEESEKHLSAFKPEK